MYLPCLATINEHMDNVSNLHSHLNVAVRNLNRIQNFAFRDFMDSIAKISTYLAEFDAHNMLVLNSFITMRRSFMSCDALSKKQTQNSWL